MVALAESMVLGDT